MAGAIAGALLLLTAGYAESLVGKFRFGGPMWIGWMVL